MGSPAAALAVTSLHFPAHVNWVAVTVATLAGMLALAACVGRHPRRDLFVSTGVLGAALFTGVTGWFLGGMLAGTLASFLAPRSRRV